MIYINAAGFETAVGTKPTFVLFAGRWSALGNVIAAKLMALDLTKVFVYQVDLDSSDGAHLAMSLSIREAPMVILFVAGVPKLRAQDLTNEMVNYLKAAQVS